LYFVQRKLSVSLYVFVLPSTRQVFFNETKVSVENMLSERDGLK
jgi:hypothetical protein